MCIAMKSILSDQQTHDAREMFDDFFERLLGAKALTSKETDTPCSVSKQLADELSQLASSSQDRLHALPKHNTYSRNIIGSQDDWIGLICRWEPNITSSIHGHPSFAYYHVLAGNIAMDFYEPINNTEARHTSTNEMCSGDSIFSNRKEGQFDNLVHRVRTTNTPVFTLHLYSDNPAKGQVFKAR